MHFENWWEHLSECDQTSPEQWSGLPTYLKVLEVSGANAKASVGVLERLAQRHPSILQLRLSLVDVLMQAGDHAMALSHAEAAVEGLLVVGGTPPPPSLLACIVLQLQTRGLHPDEFCRWLRLYALVLILIVEQTRPDEPRARDALDRLVACQVQFLFLDQADEWNSIVGRFPKLNLSRLPGEGDTREQVR